MLLLIIVIIVIADLQEQISSMQAGFHAYSHAVQHHSLMLNRQQERITELEARVEELQQTNGKRNISNPFIGYFMNQSFPYLCPEGLLFVASLTFRTVLFSKSS